MMLAVLAHSGVARHFRLLVFLQAINGRVGFLHYELPSSQDLFMQELKLTVR